MKKEIKIKFWDIDCILNVKGFIIGVLLIAGLAALLYFSVLVTIHR